MSKDPTIDIRNLKKTNLSKCRPMCTTIRLCVRMEERKEKRNRFTYFLSSRVHVCSLNERSIKFFVECIVRTLDKT